MQIDIARLGEKVYAIFMAREEMQGYVWEADWQDVLTIDQESWPENFKVDFVTHFNLGKEKIINNNVSLFCQGDIWITKSTFGPRWRLCTSAPIEIVFCVRVMFLGIKILQHIVCVGNIIVLF